MRLQSWSSSVGSGTSFPRNRLVMLSCWKPLLYLCTLLTCLNAGVFNSSEARLNPDPSQALSDIQMSWAQDSAAVNDPFVKEFQKNTGCLCRRQKTSEEPLRTIPLCPKNNENTLKKVLICKHVHCSLAKAGKHMIFLAMTSFHSSYSGPRSVSVGQPADFHRLFAWQKLCACFL